MCFWVDYLHVHWIEFRFQDMENVESTRELLINDEILHMNDVSFNN